jgi:excinuclease ABC subunit C
MDIIRKLKILPQKPGVYEFLDKTGQIIYIGKAKNLRARVRQYFGKADERPQIPYLLGEIANVDYTVVGSELESLYLENNLIKQYRPKYNIELKDDRNFAFIKIDYSTEIPQIGYSRKIDDKPLFRPPFNSPLARGEGEGREIPQIRIARKIETRPETTRLDSAVEPRRTNSSRMTRNKSNSDNSDAIRSFGSRSKYFGPFTSAKKIRDLIFTARRTFGLCTAKKVSQKPCFYFHLHRCPGVCIGKISLKDYYKHLEKIKMFFSGKTELAAKKIKQEMLKASKYKKFEQATRLRDQLQALKLLEEKQTVIMPEKVDWDIVSFAVDQNHACVNLFKVRSGKLQDKENFVYKSDTNIRIHANDTNILQIFLENYYLETSDIPKEIYLQNKIEDVKSVQKLIFSRFSKNVKISVPQRGKPKQLISLGQTNAQEYLKNWLADKAGQVDRTNSALNELKTLLNLPNIPRRIEAYDISNTAGTNPVGSMVVFVDGMPAKAQYRKFKIQSKQTPDDTGMMREMLARRLTKLPGKTLSPSPSPNGRGQGEGWPQPDLMVIDGGKGQLDAALSVLRKFQVIGLAKRIEEIFVPGKKEPIVLSHDNPALQLLQRLRDEAHRFGLAFHRQLRSRQATKSILDEIPGVGPKTKKLLKEKFGTVANVRKASLDELTKVVGEKLAKVIKQNL